MFSDELFNMKMVLLEDIKAGSAHPEIYPSDKVVNLLYRISELMFYSDQNKAPERWVKLALMRQAQEEYDSVAQQFS